MPPPPKTVTVSRTIQSDGRVRTEVQVGAERHATEPLSDSTAAVQHRADGTPEAVTVTRRVEFPTHQDALDFARGLDPSLELPRQSREEDLAFSHHSDSTDAADLNRRQDDPASHRNQRHADALQVARDLSHRLRDLTPGGVEIHDHDSMARVLDQAVPGWRKRTRDGQAPAGVWFVGTDGKARVILNSDRLRPDTPIHEIVGHGFLRAARRGDLGADFRAIWETGRKLVEADPDFMSRFHEATGDAYRDLQGDELIEEALSWSIGRQGQSVWLRDADPSLRARIREWVDRVWRQMGWKLGLRTLDQSTTVDEFTRRLNEDLRDRSDSGEFNSGLYDTRGEVGEVGFGNNAPVNTRHIFDGEINNAGKAVGFHHRQHGVDPSGARVLNIESLPNTSGVYRAKVEVRDSNGDWILKDPVSSFFPDDWSKERVLDEVADAFENAQRNIPGKPSSYFEGISSKSGIKIAGYVTPAERIATSFPIYTP